MLKLVLLSNAVLFLYYLTSNLIYLFLLITAIVKSTSHQQRLSSMHLENLRLSKFTPPVTVVAPAHNEGGNIVESVAGLLDLDYPMLEVIIVNDGSSDNTLERLTIAYDLRPVHLLYVPEIQTARVRKLYRSVRDPRLVVVDKESAGTKADAVNAGLNVAGSPYVCIVDADSLLERDSLLRVMSGIFSDPEFSVAAGGIVRVLNGCSVSHGALTHIRMPRNPIEAIQRRLRSYRAPASVLAGATNGLPHQLHPRPCLLDRGAFRSQVTCRPAGALAAGSA